jgi:hypothetical protein
MKNKGLQIVVRTALLLAIVTVFQMMRPLFMWDQTVAQIVVGSLVNVVLFVSAATVGWRGSIFVAVLTPFVAWLQNQIPHPLLIPFVALGNLALVLVFELIERQSNKNPAMWAGEAVAAVVKFVVLYLAVVQLFVPFILPGLGLKSQVAGVLSLSFSWLQLVTAAIGGVVAFPVIKGLRRALRKEKGAD